MRWNQELLPLLLVAVVESMTAPVIDRDSYATLMPTRTAHAVRFDFVAFHKPCKLGSAGKESLELLYGIHSAR